MFEPENENEKSHVLMKLQKNNQVSNNNFIFYEEKCTDIFSHTVTNIFVNNSFN